jgi:hypothetical protein
VSQLFEGWFFAAPLERWLETPQRAARIEFMRIFTPLAILGFMLQRAAFPDEWLGPNGFHIPDLGGDPRQPLYIPALPTWAAYAVAITLVGSALCVSIGFRARKLAFVFAACAAYCALSDRLTSFSVSKMSPMLAVTIGLSPCGRMWSVDAWLARRRRGGKKAKRAPDVPSGSIRFVQVLMPTIYSASGIAKARGDWLTHSHLLWTHLHDTYQTSVTVALANVVPGWGWNFFQGLTLFFEMFAPILFSWRRTRVLGLVLGAGMHTMIGLMFGPVRYFAMMMISLLVTAYVPDEWWDEVTRRLRRRKPSAAV